MATVRVNHVFPVSLLFKDFKCILQDMPPKCNAHPVKSL